MSLAWWITVACLAAYVLVCLIVALIQGRSRYVYGENAPIPKIGQRARTARPDGDPNRG